MIIGLTGGIGSGKSAAAKYFIELGIDVIDADEVSKNVLIKNEQAKKIFIGEFGNQYINNNEIDRDVAIVRSGKVSILIVSFHLKADKKIYSSLAVYWQW